MSTIGGDGGIRRALEATGSLIDSVSRARDLARRLRDMLDERNAHGPRETARLLLEIPRLSAEAQDAGRLPERSRFRRRFEGTSGGPWS